MTTDPDHAPTPIRTALISVSDKTGVVDLARRIVACGVTTILSTGGTARVLSKAGIEVLDVAAYTGHPEIMDGRVKTLHPKIHGGLLARRDRPGDLAAVETHAIRLIELVIVNLYPFEQTVARWPHEVDTAEVLENIDIGGPSMLRAAAKNHPHVAVVVDPGDYEPLLSELEATGGLSAATRERLAGKAFQRTAAYDAAITTFFQRLAAAATTAEPSGGEGFPARLTPALEKVADLRYGENPHQAAALYRDSVGRGPSLADAEQLAGEPLSYNNLLDADAALGFVLEFGQGAPVAAIFKHSNPCGAAVAASPSSAFTRAKAADPLSAFGGIVALNEAITPALAELIVAGKKFDLVLAPAVEPEALAILTTRKKWGAKLRVLAVGPLPAPESDGLALRQLRSVQGGVLVQTRDTTLFGKQGLTTVTQATPGDRALRDLGFAWTVAKHVKSNAIVLVKDGVAIGVGAGQMSRLDAAHLAISRARATAERAEKSPDDYLKDSVAASDAFFPFADAVEHAADAGITAVIQPGGSVNDDKVIAACDARGVAMLFTGVRHFRH